MSPGHFKTNEVIIVTPGIDFQQMNIMKLSFILA